MSKAVIQQHAQKYLSALGKIEIKNGHRKAHDIYAATIVVTCPDRVEYYDIWAGDGAVGMIKTRSQPLPSLPLFD